MNIHESAEDYLEAILRLKEAKGYARSVDISLLLGVTKPSVSVAMKRLRENGYLTMDADNLITLTPAGMEIARSIYDRHKTLSSFLESLGVDSDVAREDACKIEHDISEESFTAIRKLMQEREQEQKADGKARQGKLDRVDLTGDEFQHHLKGGKHDHRHSNIAVSLFHTHLPLCISIPFSQNQLSMASNSVSDSTGIPSSWALRSLEPAASPATT